MDNPEEAQYIADNADIDGIGEFFNRTGAVELISLLDRSGYRFDEIDNELAVSRGVLNERITEARGLKLVDLGQTSRDEKIYRVHKLTFMGEAIKDQLKEIGLVQTHERLRTLMKEYENQEAGFLEWMQDEDAVDVQITSKVEQIIRSN